MLDAFCSLNSQSDKVDFDAFSALFEEGKMASAMT
jgi:hypothetical protein